MINEKPLSDFCSGVNFNASEKAAELGEEPCQKMQMTSM
jgi:hypothetical protein